MANFTTDWWTHNVPTWEKYVLPVLGFNEEIHVLEIGTYEGRSALWMADHLMIHEDSTITCVDAWPSKEIQARFWSNTKDKHNIIEWKGHWRSSLEAMIEEKCKYDLIYIDADHQAKSVIEQAMMCMRVLKPGGLMIFDDYGLKTKLGSLPLSAGIDAFLLLWRADVEVLHMGYQVIIRKLN